MKTLLLICIISTALLCNTFSQADPLIIATDKLGYELSRLEHYINEEMITLIENDIEVYFPDEFFLEMEELKLAVVEQIEIDDFDIYFDDEYYFESGELQINHLKHHFQEENEGHEVAREKLLEALETYETDDPESSKYLDDKIDSWRKNNAPQKKRPYFPVP